INQFNPVSVLANAATGATTAFGQFAMDKFDEYSAEAYLAGKYRGFSLVVDGWARVLNDFEAPKNVGGLNPSRVILYQPGAGVAPSATTVGAGTAGVFPRRAIYDYGTLLQGGYFIIPKKLEVAGRWAWLYGESGDVFGDGVRRTMTVPGAPAGL